MFSEDKESSLNKYLFKKEERLLQGEEVGSSHSVRQPLLSDSIIDQDTMPMAAIRGDPLSSILNQDTVTTPIPHQPMPSLVNQDTAVMPVTHQAELPQRMRRNLWQNVVAMVLSRVKEPEPEKWSQTLVHKALKVQNKPLGWLALLTVINSLGVFLAAYACVLSIHTNSDQEIYLWLGLSLIFAPSFLRLLMPIVSRVERIGILCSVGFSVYIIPEILSPLHFFFVDEYMHLRTVGDIIRTNHLFNPNSMLPISPLYPGLEIMTNALGSMSGLDPFTSGLIVTGMARIIVMLALYLLFEQVTKSARTASIATMLYTTNAGFFMFDSLFVYEALGLAIGIFMLFVLYRSGTVATGKGSFLLVACIALGTLTATHHVSDLFFVGILILWTLIQKIVRQPLLKSPITGVTLVGLLLTFTWIFVIAKPVIGYLSAPVVGTLAQVQGVLLGANHARHLFVDYTGGHPTPLGYQLIMLTSIGLVTLSIPFAFLCLWHRYRYKSFPFMLALVSLLYPCTQAMRVASESADIADRASPFIFVAVSFALAILIVQMWPVQRLKPMHMLVITLIASLVFLGGGIVGSGPSWRLMPGSYLVGADARSIDRESVQAALWFPEYLGLDNRIYTNSTNALLMNSFGNQHSVSIPADGVDISPVFYAPQYHSWETSILQRGRVAYLAVDMRMSIMLPAKGYYFEGEEEPDINVTTPISRQALTKFDSVSHMNRIFDSGNIVIYDIGELIDASKES